MSSAVALGILAISAGPAQADTVCSQQWYLDAMRAEEMWKTSTGAGVTVAVIDSGVDADLPDLEGQVLPGRDFAGVAGDAHSDYDGHGSTMAVLIAGNGKSNGGTGAYGLAPGAKILPLRVLSDAAPRTRVSPETALASAIRFAADSDAKIINLSMAHVYEGPREAVAVDYALSKGKLVFAGVGNWGHEDNRVVYPAAHPGVVGVAAVDQSIKATEISERGPQVDLAAPGDNIVATCKGGTGLCRTRGTSDATALASASAALVWSAHPDWTANQVLRVLINTAGGPKSGEKRSDTIGYGVVRPRIALQNPGDPGPADVSPLPELAAAASKARPSTFAPRANAEEASGDGYLLSQRNLVVAGIVAAVGLVAAVAIPITRRRRPLPR
ncbi:type VII secretion-associated serine protease mycosin [Streptomyces griseocarneus]|uniref:type VII secretion-associated serine protease mycosin n=1 Tax=Streptomyces griseocarneus TaxID=51201 RepID=UPI0019A0938A|nr:type VII secretion-associated serine protease mycosin [Streptomyces griseocarneus]MBZ6477107.1 type VII secretion-associated serine protease mycosin [Streptomyces griseocarneus]GHG70497.1 type VII secretion-associated serine protease [Streptomyces griseocarneus]